MKHTAKKAVKQPSTKTTTKLYHYKGCGLDNVWLKGGVNIVETPRGKAIQIENQKGLHKAIGHWLVHEKKNLTGKEFRFLRHEINLTQQYLAALLNTDVQNVGRWERDEGDKIPGPAQNIVRLLYEEKINDNRAICEPLARLAELDEQKTDEEEDIEMEAGPEGWSIAA